MMAGAASVEHDKIEAFQKQMLQFGLQEGRHTLPWRQTRDPWQLLVAEVLLRKTMTWQAVDVFNRLKDLGPSEVVAMSDDALETILQPIGLYKVRAVGLKAIARSVVYASAEELHSDKYLRSLPGVGRYISNSVRCCAYGDAAPALDTNMIRVVQRVFGWQSSRKRAREDSALWAFADTLVPIDAAREFNWAVLDFGAAICTARKPKCPICPLNDLCAFYLTQQAADQVSHDR